eukprot:2348057-Amphidinium_carterae.1
MKPCPDDIAHKPSTQTKLLPKEVSSYCFISPLPRTMSMFVQFSPERAGDDSRTGALGIDLSCFCKAIHSDSLDSHLHTFIRFSIWARVLEVQSQF